MVQLCAHARSLRERDNWLTGMGGGICLRSLPAAACVGDWPARASAGGRACARARVRGAGRCVERCGGEARARMLAVAATRFPSSARHSSVTSWEQGRTALQKVWPRGHQRRVEPRPDVRFPSLQTATPAPPPPPPSCPWRTWQLHAGKRIAGQLTRDGSVLDSMTLSPGGARGCHSGFEDWGGINPSLSVSWSLWAEGRGCVTVAVGERVEAPSERGNARLLKPWKEMGNE